MSMVTRAWQALEAHAETLKTTHLRGLFERDPGRAERYRIEAAGWLLDYSKNRIDDRAVALLLDLARAAELEAWRERLFRGERINHTENRAVLHTALRDRSGGVLEVDGRDLLAEVRAERERLYRFAEAVRGGDWRGGTGEPIEDVVNIGIGGSDLGPRMVCEALAPYAEPRLRLHFVANIDGEDIHDVLQRCRPERTLFIVSSKSFTTQETLNNARAARQWFLEQGGREADLAKHFVAVTANNRLATEFGIGREQQFAMWDWVGGRYSLWSSIGLPIVIALGPAGFDALLDGAWAMDRHFREAPLEKNMPVILGLIGVWYNNVLGFQTHAILPYAQRLARLPEYLQQADMESNGKSVDRAGRPVERQTGPVIWGGVGTNAQHAFFQLMHQGTKPIPADFILFRESRAPWPPHQRMLLANALGQMEALMRGKTAEEVRAELAGRGVEGAAAEALLPYLVFEGNKPSNALLAERLEPKTLGALIALYEHKIFVQSVIWNINAYDQWGVEYGKQLARGLLEVLEGRAPAEGYSGSTLALLARLRGD
ncbi:MAG: glucose-6-phosphate isomerase 1 [Gammaproteobacteria bacterium]|nr:MAG: glucose-6-phosphate isomerase 1 [Gammaproteobacteria bacterium]